MQAPPDLQRSGLAGLRERLRFLFKLRGLRGREIADLVSFATGSLGEFLDRALESPHLKSLVLANSLYGKHGLDDTEIRAVSGSAARRELR